ncbi:sterigmatocystin biosynthesis monooxygenase stcW [Lecanosticta acicola]|uniref:Sterigmatocystin biosynthesis monooxygenase stcW n=1 Tax=Lecanosticta acicola TaxID=111012 RepID=A0AAI8YTE9_9PEZI|nr:sterigmatocystin biosynthesis monooxygenase stcW [Lecanosticta acicola]
MAPDLNAVAGGEKFDYSQPGSSGYEVKQDLTWNDPNNRKLRVLTIGAGVSGILMAYQIQKQCGNVEHVVYEKNEDIGGTWLENRYPGCACDVPSHAYTYQFALNPDWPRFFSYSPDIWKYLDKVCNTFDLRKYMTFNTEVVGAYWNDDRGQWTVKLRNNKSGEEIEDHCHLLLHGTGILNNFKWPEIPGLKDRFKGKVVHTARWPNEYQKEQWGERIAIIGSGASSIQTVPTMQPHVKHMDVFVRTGYIANNYGQNKEYDQKERDDFRNDPKALVAHAKDIEDQLNGLWGAFYSDTEAQQQGQETYKARMAEFIKDKRLLEGFTPSFGVGCRRITPGDPYMLAIQEPNVDVHFTAVKSCTEDGVVGEDGEERKVDTIVCATGFDVSYRPRFPLVGKSGVDLKEKWGICPEGYLGLGIPDFPNFLTFIGPTWPVENGSVMGPLHSVSEYAIQIIKKMQNENIKSWTPRQDITDDFNSHVQEWIKHTVWKENCRSWYKNNETGRVNAVWPGSSMHYQQVIERPRYEDFDIEYHDKNRWAMLGMGWTVENRKGAEEADCSPYLNLKTIDPKWYEANGGDLEKLKAQVNEYNRWQ